MHPTLALLAPSPQRLMPLAAGFAIVATTPIELMGAAQPLLASAQRLQQTLRQRGVDAPIHAGSRDGAAIRLSVDPAQATRGQGYKLLIEPTGITLVGADAAGAFYGVCTLCQLVTLADADLTLPGAIIHDWPDLPQRGIMFDVTRDRVPTMQTLFDLVDLLAGLKVNQLQLYTEHAFAYRGHEVVWQDASPITGEEILALDAYCRERFVELVPNQNSFGHMHRWLKHDAYVHLAESSAGMMHSFSTAREPFSLCAVDPATIDLLDDLYGQLLPHFSSRQLNVGLDETWDLGTGRSKAACDERGKGRVYLAFLNKLYALTQRYGVTMQFWSDIIVRDEPALVAELPRDVIALEWGYEADYPFAEHAALIAASGRSFYVCPGTSSWNTLAGRTDNTLANIANAVRNGFAHGAIGVLTTDWGDNGHPQPLPVSYLGFMASAIMGWRADTADAPEQLPMAALLDAHIFRDRAGVMGQLAYDLGTIYRLPGVKVHNSSILFWLLIYPDGLPPMRLGEGTLTPAALEETLAALDDMLASLATAQMDRADAALVRDEYAWVGDMLRFACRLGLEWLPTGIDQPVTGVNAATRHRLAGDLRGLIDRHRELWLQRSRPGGLADALSRFETTLARLAE